MSDSDSTENDARIERPTFVATVFCVGLLASVAFSGNEQVAVACAVLALGTGAAQVLGTHRIHVVAVPIIGFLALWVASGLVAGGYPDDASALQQFIRSEGRIIGAYLPAILLAGMPRNRLRPAAHVALSLTVWLHVAILVAAITGAWPGLIKSGNFHGFASSHHVPGFLFGASAIYFASQWLERHRPSIILAGIGSMTLVLASGSRTAMLGLLVAVLAYQLRVRGLGRKVRTAVLVAVIVITASTVNDRLNTTALALTSETFYTDAYRLFHEPQQTGTRVVLDGERPAPVSNALRRFGLWGLAWQQFSISPLVGIGSWRLNDTDISYRGLPGVAALATGGNRHFSDFGAHNLWLQILAENGVIGLGLFGAIWWTIYRRFGEREGGPYGRAAHLVVVFGLACSLTSNALASPGFLFPALIIIFPARG